MNPEDRKTPENFLTDLFNLVLDNENKTKIETRIRENINHLEAKKTKIQRASINPSVKRQKLASIESELSAWRAFSEFLPLYRAMQDEQKLPLILAFIYGKYKQGLAVFTEEQKHLYGKGADGDFFSQLLDINLEAAMPEGDSNEIKSLRLALHNLNKEFAAVYQGCTYVKAAEAYKAHNGRISLDAADQLNKISIMAQESKHLLEQINKPDNNFDQKNTAINKFHSNVSKGKNTLTPKQKRAVLAVVGVALLVAAAALMIIPGGFGAWSAVTMLTFGLLTGLGFTSGIVGGGILRYVSPFRSTNLNHRIDVQNQSEKVKQAANKLVESEQEQNATAAKEAGLFKRNVLRPQQSIHTPETNFGVG